MGELYKTRGGTFFFLSVIVFFGVGTRVIAEDDYSWIKDSIVVRTTEKVTCDSEGNVQKAETIKNSKITITQTVKERKEKDQYGRLNVVGCERTTESVDTDGCKTIVVEKAADQNSSFEVTFVNRTKKTPTGYVTTVESIDEFGELRMVKRVIESVDESGVSTTITELPDKNDRMVVTESVNKY